MLRTSNMSKYCVLAVDCSGSVQNSEIYWDNVKKLFDRVNTEYDKQFIIIWSGVGYESNSEELLASIAQRNNSRLCGTTDPYCIWPNLSKILLSNNELATSPYDFYLTTDGEIGDYEYSRYHECYEELNIKPRNINIHFFGTLEFMNMRFLDGFSQSIKYEINGVDLSGAPASWSSTKLPTKMLYDELCALPSFRKLKDGIGDDELITDVLTELYKDLYQKRIEYNEDEIGDIFKRFVDSVNGIVHRQYMNTQKHINNEFHQLFTNWELNSSTIFASVVEQIKVLLSSNLQSILGKIVELGNGQTRIDRRLTAYGDDWYQRLKSSIASAANNNCDVDVDNEDNDDDPAQNSSEVVECPILYIDSSEYSKFCVLWMSEKINGFASLDITAKSEIHQKQQQILIESRRKLAQNSMYLFEILNGDYLNERIPQANQQISIDALLGIKDAQIIDENSTADIVYLSPLHRLPCFGLILYTIDDKTPMTENEMNILLHNYCTLSRLLFGKDRYTGSYSLLFTYFLYTLYRCDRAESYVKQCIKTTIRRLAKVLDCPFMLVKGLEPSFRTRVHNAILFHTKIFPKEYQSLQTGINFSGTFNVLRRNITHSKMFLEMAKDMFDLDYEKTYDYSLWLFWHYMCRCDLPHTKKAVHFRQIAITKIQNWKPLPHSEKVKIILTEGEPTAVPYLDYLQNVTFVDVVKLILLFEKTKTPRLLENLSYLHAIELHENESHWYNVKPIEKIPSISCSIDKMTFCKSLCNFPFACPFTGLPRTECYSAQCFDIQKYGYVSAKYGHSYVERCKKLILKKSKNTTTMEIPSLEELKKYVVECTPWCVFHNDLDSKLGRIIELFSDWYNWFKNVSQDDAEKYLQHGSDWKKVFAISNDVIVNCTCAAHFV